MKEYLKSHFKYCNQANFEKFLTKSFEKNCFYFSFQFIFKDFFQECVLQHNLTSSNKKRQ